jgi:hypothetical protein
MLRKSYLAILTTGICSLGACSHVPAYETPIRPVPTNWSAASDSSAAGVESYETHWRKFFVGPDGAYPLRVIVTCLP